MGATTPHSVSALLLSAGLLAGLMAVSATPVAADDDSTPEPAVGVDALSGLSSGLGDGDTSDRVPTGDPNDPLAGGPGGTSDVSDGDATGADTGTTDGSDTTGADTGTTGGSDATDPATSSANPMFKLMLDLILDDVQAAETEARMAGKTLTEAQRTDVARESVKDLITFLQETGLLGEVDKRELLKQIEGIPTEPEE